MDNAYVKGMDETEVLCTILSPYAISLLEYSMLLKDENLKSKFSGDKLWGEFVDHWNLSAMFPITDEFKYASVSIVKELK